VVAGIIGARLVHVVDQQSYYVAHPEQILFIWTGGIAVWGAAIGGVLGGLAVALRRRVAIGFGADAAVAGIGLGFAIGRIGDIIKGEHHATACTPPAGICVTYAHPDTLGQGPAFADARFSPGPVHLAVAYDMAWNLAGVALVLWLRRTTAGRWSEGAIFWLWMLWYAVGRFALGFLRTGDPNYAFGLREDQVIAILVAAAAIPMLARLFMRAPQPRVEPA
jgi:phosphatidylglycerol:prolipoprotein diacylglycerol transferase